MKIFKRKNKQNRKRPKQEDIRNSQAPVMRYYRPDQARSENNRKDTSRVHRNVDKDQSKKPHSSFFVSLMNWIVVGVLCFVIAANLTLSNAPTIKYKANEEYALRGVEEYKKGISELIDESLMNRSKITFRSADFERDLRRIFPEVENATAIVPLVGRNLHVELSFIEPILRLRSAQDARTGVVGRNGSLLALTNENNFQDNQFKPDKLPLLSLQPDLPVDLGQQLLTEAESDLISLIMNEFDGSSPHLHRPTLFEYSLPTREIRVRFEGAGYYAKFTPEGDTRLQLGATIATLERLFETNQLPVEYIDGRVESRVFVK